MILPGPDDHITWYSPLMVGYTGHRRSKAPSTQSADVGLIPDEPQLAFPIATMDWRTWLKDHSGNVLLLAVAPYGLPMPFALLWSRSLLGYEPTIKLPGRVGGVVPVDDEQALLLHVDRQVGVPVETQTKQVYELVRDPEAAEWAEAKRKERRKVSWWASRPEPEFALEDAWARDGYMTLDQYAATLRTTEAAA